MGTCCASVKTSVSPVKLSSTLNNLTKSHRPEDLETLDKSWKVLRGLPSTTPEKSGQEKQFFLSGSNSLSFFTDIGLTTSCKKGLKSAPFNQDDFSVVFDKGLLFISVYDGHGVNGNEISNYLHIVLPNMILSHPSFPGDVESVLRESFFKCNIYLHQYCETIQKSTELSGSTCTITVIHNNILYICNIGDSRAMFVDSNKNVLKLTVDHKPNDPKELERILSSGGEVRQLESESNYRIFVKNMRMPGISVSRAFGDSIAQTIGVTVSPDVSKRTLDPDDLFLIICSDGVWEFLNESKVKDLVCVSENPAHDLTQAAWDKWIENEIDAVDDITAVILNLRLYSNFLTNNEVNN